MASSKAKAIEPPRRRLESTRSDVSNCVGEEILVLLRETDELSHCIHDDAPKTNVWWCTLVGHDDAGIWVEPLSWVEKARTGKAPSVWHLMIPSSNIVGIMVDSDRSRDSRLSQWKNSRAAGKARVS